MRQISLFLGIIASIIFTACEGPQGPEGIPGLDGVNITGAAFDRDVDFGFDDDYKVRLIFPGNIEPAESDAVMVYHLVENNGKDIWQPLPRNLFLEDGILSYGFEYRFDLNGPDYVELFLDGTVDFSAEINDAFTRNQVFRVAVLPVDLFDSRTDLKTLDYDSLHSIIPIEEDFTVQF